VLSEGEIKVSDKVILRFVALDRWGSICFPHPSYWMRVLRCWVSLVVLGFWILKGT
jgi:hypothetical protein